eukprot:gene8847-10887_t
MSAAKDRVISTPMAEDPITRARAVAPLIEAAAPRIEADRALPPDLLEALHVEAAGAVQLLHADDRNGDRHVLHGFLPAARRDDDVGRGRCALDVLRGPLDFTGRYLRRFGRHR